ncbi:MAG: hypothetical protein JW737_09360 [Acidobacteria bacterium]|nr:hypothetical protein [Acidobacteriota bacterium]
MLKKFIPFICILLLFASFIFTQDALQPKALLNNGDVEKFIKTFPAMLDELEPMGLIFNPQDGTFSIPEDSRKLSGYKAVLVRFGWDKSFYEKSRKILRIYTYLKYGEDAVDLTNKTDEEADSLARNESDIPKIMDVNKPKPEEKKPEEITPPQKLLLHPDDIAKVKPQLTKLKEILLDEDEMIIEE